MSELLYLFYTQWLAWLVLGSVLLTAGVDAARRKAWQGGFFWRHWWHTPILVALEYLLGRLLYAPVWYTLVDSLGMHEVPATTLAIFPAEILGFTIVALGWGVWQLWCALRRRRSSDQGSPPTRIRSPN
jgi:hypothetical protein